MSDTIKYNAVADTGIETTDALWEKLCELFNDGEYSDEIQLLYTDTEAWEGLLAHDKIIHDALIELFPIDGTVEFLTLYEK